MEAKVDKYNSLVPYVNFETKPYPTLAFKDEVTKKIYQTWEVVIIPRVIYDEVVKDEVKAFDDIRRG